MPAPLYPPVAARAPSPEIVTDAEPSTARPAECQPPMSVFSPASVNDASTPETTTKGAIPFVEQSISTPSIVTFAFAPTRTWTFVARPATT